MSTKPDNDVVSSQSNLTNQAVNVDKSTVDDNKTKQCNLALHEQQYGCSKAKSFRGEEVLHERRRQQHAPPEQTTDPDMSAHGRNSFVKQGVDRELMLGANLSHTSTHPPSPLSIVNIATGLRREEAPGWLADVRTEQGKSFTTGAQHYGATQGLVHTDAGSHGDVVRAHVSSLNEVDFQDLVRGSCSRRRNVGFVFTIRFIT